VAWNLPFTGCLRKLKKFRKSGEGETKMKNNVIRMVLAVGAACVCGSALDAQTYILSAKIPFAFQAAGKAFPAGKYTVAERGDSRVPSVQSSTTGESVFIAGADHSLSPAGPARLVFHCYSGYTCFLAEIRPTAGSGSKVSMTKAEKAIVQGEGPREMATISVDLRRAD
jgi:hypothetical protein